MPGAVLEAFCAFVSARGFQILELCYTSSLVTKPEYFRRNCFRDLGATIKPSQPRVFFYAQLYPGRSWERKTNRQIECHPTLSPKYITQDTAILLF